MPATDVDTKPSNMTGFTAISPWKRSVLPTKTAKDLDGILSFFEQAFETFDDAMKEFVQHLGSNRSHGGGNGINGGVKVSNEKGMEVLYREYIKCADNPVPYSQFFVYLTSLSTIIPAVDADDKKGATTTSLWSQIIARHDKSATDHPQFVDLFSEYTLPPVPVIREVCGETNRFVYPADSVDRFTGTFLLTGSISPTQVWNRIHLLAMEDSVNEHRFYISKKEGSQNTIVITLVDKNGIFTHDVDVDPDQFHVALTYDTDNRVNIYYKPATTSILTNSVSFPVAFTLPRAPLQFYYFHPIQKIEETTGLNSVFVFKDALSQTDIEMMWHDM